MARPAKAITAATGTRTKADVALRTEIEAQMQDGKVPEPPEWLTPAQSALFDKIIEYCVHTGILTSVDSTSLALFCVAADRLEEIETMINEDPDRMFDRNLMTARSGYEKTMWRGCQEFCLTPQARAKIGSLTLAARKEAEDPLVSALGGV